MEEYNYTPDDFEKIKSYENLYLLRVNKHRQFDEKHPFYKEVLGRIFQQFKSDFNRYMTNKDSVKLVLLNYIAKRINEKLDDANLFNEQEELESIQKSINSYLNPIYQKHVFVPKNLIKAKRWIKNAEDIMDQMRDNIKIIDRFYTVNANNTETKTKKLPYVPNSKYWMRKLLKSILYHTPQASFKLRFNDGQMLYYTLTREKLQTILREIEADREIITEYSGSDNEFLNNILDIDEMKLVKFRPAQNQAAHGRWFKYFHNLINMNFNRYGIFTQKSEKSVKQHCLYTALKYAGLDKLKLEILKLNITAEDFPMTKFEQLTKNLEVCIKVYKYSPKYNENGEIISWNTHNKTFGNKDNQVLEIGLIDNHYFVKDKKTKITKYAIENYENIKDINEYNYIYTKLKSDSYKRNKTELKMVDSATLFKMLLERKNTLLTPIQFDEDDLKSTLRLHLDKDYTSLEYSENSAVEFKKRQKLEFIGFPALSKDRTRFLDKSIDKYYFNTVGITNVEYIEQIMDEHYKKKCECDKLLNSYCDFVAFRTGEKISIPPTLVGNNPIPNVSDSITPYEKIFFDTETYKNVSGVHKIYYIGSYNYTHNTYQGFKGKNCVDEFLESLPENSIMWAHNAGYDWRFLLKSKMVKFNRYLKKGTGIYTVAGIIKSKETGVKKFIIKDTYKIISSPLSKFDQLFKLSIKKEVMPYDLYNKSVIENPIIPLIKSKKYLSEDDYKILVNNSRDWDIIHYCECHNSEDDIKLINNCNNCQFDALEYSAKYCELDCKVLAQGYTTIHRWLFEITCKKDDNGNIIKYDGLNVDNYVSISSYVDSYLKKENCYFGTYKLTGIPQDFISRSIVGGRVMCAENKKIVSNKALSDFDAVSLYPSAMSRIKGFLMGKPQVISQKMLNLNKPNDPYKLYRFLNNHTDGYFVEIIIKSIGINRKFPLQSYKNDDGIRNFTNDLIGKKLVVDNIALQDLVEFQRAEFEIIRGYYFNEGYNDKVIDIIRNLFENRLRFKKLGNPIQEAIKLMMNSSYGKTILKAPELDYTIFNNKEDFWTYYMKNQYKIKSATKIAYNKYIIHTYKSLLTHYNFPHIGSQILSMSKRIMNEVMCLGEDNDINMYYQDTDSIHMDFDQVSELQKLYNNKYKRELIGKGLGQFHTDFNLDGADESTIKAVKSIFLGKKCYIDCLEGISNADEDLIIKGYHIRMKGVPTKCIENTAKNMGLTPYELYKKHYDGDKITYDLINDSGRVFFEQMNDLRIKTKTEFKRSLRFK